ncbi:hypothetical protein PV326_008421 [Microctonus aethiopoides]|nr:hypothetical protein PV326_008421 [Microctonus aethiopoides]
MRHFAPADGLSITINAADHHYYIVICVQSHICDSSKALLTACIATYTKYRTIEEYWDAFLYNCNFIDNETLISIDVAHYVKLWANFLTNKPRRIKVFYSACSGRLIMCKNVPDASETDGFLNNGQRTKTETRKCYLKALITDELEHYEKLSHLLETESNSGIETDSESESQIVSDFQSQLSSQIDLNSAEKKEIYQREKVVLGSSKWK